MLKQELTTFNAVEESSNPGSAVYFIPMSGILLREDSLLVSSEVLYAALEYPLLEISHSEADDLTRGVNIFTQ